jgi:capsular polysaccharide transport system permease protein
MAATAVEETAARPALAPTATAPATGAGLPIRSPRTPALWHGRRGAPILASVARQRRLPIGLLSFLLAVALPTALAAAYYLLLAADQYVAELRFGLRSADPPRGDPTAFLQGGAAASRLGLDSYVVVQYIGSRAAVDDLSRTLDLRAIFSVPQADFLARLRLPVPVEDLVAYWRNQIDAFFDATDGTIVVRARAFDPTDALALARGILAASERLVNDLSARARRDALRDCEDEVRRAEQRLSRALAQLRQFRDREGVIDPRKTAEATTALAGRLRDELVRTGSELSALKETMQDDAAPLKLLEARMRALEAQRRAVESEVTDGEQSRKEALSRIMGAYEQLESERSFAETAYRHALESLDRARLDAARQHLYVADFVPPSLPEKPLYPRRLRSLGIVFLIAFATWAVGGLVIRSVRDHL